MKALKYFMASVLLGGCALASSAASGTEPTLFGYQHNYNLGTVPTGLFEIAPGQQNPNFLWDDTIYKQANGTTTGYVMTSGWLRDGKLCGYVTQYPTPSNSYYKYVERDLKTGEVTKEVNVDLSTSWENCFLSATYCPDDDRIYGYGFNAARTSFAFKSAPASNPSQAVIIKETGKSYPGSIAYNPEEGTFYGVMNVKNGDGYYDNTFVSIDVNTGQTTEVFKLNMGVDSDIKCTGGLLWEPSRQEFVWNWYTVHDGQSPQSKLVAINPVTKSITTLKNFPTGYNFLYFVSQDNEPVANATAPAQISDFNATVGTDNNVNISFMLPSRYENGNSIEGNVTYTIYVDGKQVKSAAAAAGSNVSYSQNLTDGTHFFRVVTSVNGVESLSSVNAVYVGDDSPCAPENIVLTTTNLTWNAVTQGIAGNTLSNVKYRVAINGMTVAETANTSFDVTDVVLTDYDLTNYQAQVWAIYNGRESKAGYSNSLIVGEPWSVPFTIEPTARQFSLMEQFDADNDGVQWSLDSDDLSDGYYLTSGFSRNNASDDWIFLPKFKASADKVYEISFDVLLADVDLYGGKAEVWIGDAPTKDAMKKEIVPAISILSDNANETYTGQFRPDGDLTGKDLYVGIGVTSREGTLCPLRFQNISVKDANINMSAPAQVSNLAAAPKEDDPKYSKVTFTMPEKTLSGTALSASEQIKAIIIVQESNTTTTVTGKPGEQVAAEILTGAKECMISVTPSVNNVNGMSANCVNGYDVAIPGAVRNLTYAFDKTDCNLYIHWDAPDKDINGNPMSGDQCNYNVWMQNPETNEFEFAVNVPYPLQFATMNMDNNTTLQDLKIAITAANRYGESTERVYLITQVGNPLSMPISDDLNGNEFRYGPITYYVADPYDKAKIEWNNPSKANWGLSDAMLNVEGDVLCGIPSTPGAMTRLDLPKVSTANYTDIKLELDIWTGENAAETTIKSIYASDETFDHIDIEYYPAVMADIMKIPAGSGYEKVTVPFTEQSHLPWMNVVIESVYPSLNSRFILAGYALKGTVSGIDEVEETLFGTIIGQTGCIAINGYDGEQVRIYNIDGTLAATQRLSDSSSRISVPAGIYIVNAGRRTAKVVVK
ncbi:MAG: T9SS type A sorting domain-containing protein [Prevotella sp.]|nr:T9SS type A sorting domain-containing protein [Prevotella sp.]MCM1074637.1 T9SS type A sorting domain-containing protein [Ruminococcus sp.]